MRFFYIVRPVSESWEVGFGDQGTRFVYAGREDALQVALAAAQRHWLTQKQPSGVRVEGPGQAVEVVAEYGDVPCPSVEP